MPSYSFLNTSTATISASLLVTNTLAAANLYAIVVMPIYNATQVA
jgi:hypothetical protein